MLKPDPTLTLRRGDRIVLSGQRAAFVDAERAIGPEVDDPALLAIPLATAAAVCLYASARAQRTSLGVN